ncbi:DUF2011 domain-containing protein [Aspergillus lucknowensis]|uniref:Uncharacterized protein n=1 Tax=Aspergillus lucknowensis TaxID=176173 RepID=A0ABR4M0H9_9EURO
MFDLPNAKRVRRNELLSRTSSPSPSPPPESAYPDAQARLSALLNLDLGPAPLQEHTTAQEIPQKGSKDEDEEQEFEFRLFSAPAPAPALAARVSGGEVQRTGTDTATGDFGTQKLRIRLRSPTPTTGGSREGRFVNPFRGWSYYFTTPGLFSGENKKSSDDEDAEVLAKRKQFADVAVTGEDIMGSSSVPWPGCHLPWRVIRLKREHTKLPLGEKSMSSTATTYVTESAERISLSRKKPGKKRRIQLRKRAVIAERAKETEAEKRNRKNREKKIKRRQKAREQKAATATAGHESNSTALDQTGKNSKSSAESD